jgi:hypothetical protein
MFRGGTMRRIRLFLLFAGVAGNLSLSAQTATPTPPPPQSARQALIEMFVGKGEKDFEKHLPEAAHQALIHKGETPETSTILRISTIGRQLTAQGQHLETFDTGPIILSFDESAHEKVEVSVEHDSLLGEDDEIEVSVHYYKEGQEQSLPVVPRLTFTLRQEKEIWRLTEIVAAAHVPLTDSDYLKGLRKLQDEENESTARNRVNVIAMAETNYLSKHPDRGYACTLSTLFAPDASADPQQGGFNYPTEFSNEESSGYRFSISGCEGTPASKYRIAAVPDDSDSGLKTFCQDQSGTIKFTTDGKSSSCFSRGQPLNSGAATGAID